MIILEKTKQERLSDKYQDLLGKYRNLESKYGELTTNQKIIKDRIDEMEKKP